MNISKIISVSTLSVIFLLCPLWVSNIAHADKSWLSPVATAQVKYDDNVFLVARDESPIDEIGDTSTSDVILEVSGGLRGEISSARNRDFMLEAQVFRREYNRFNRLDFTGGNVKANVGFEVSRSWTASLDYDFIKDQSSLNDQRLPFADSFDFHRAKLRMIRGFGNYSNVYVFGSFNDKQYEERLILDNRRAQGGVGYQYLTPKKSSFALEISTALGEYTNFDEAGLGGPDPFSGDFDDSFGSAIGDFDEDLALAKFRVYPSPKTQLNADVGYVNRTYEDSLSEFDYDGLVFDLSFNWDLSSRTEVTTQYIKQLNDTENTSALFTRENQASIQFKWLASENLELSANVKYRDIDFIQIGGDRIDDVTALEIKSNYKLSSMFDLEVAFRDQSRDSTNLANEFDKAVGLVSIAYNRKR